MKILLPFVLLLLSLFGACTSKTRKEANKEVEKKDTIPTKITQIPQPKLGIEIAPESAKENKAEKPKFPKLQPLAKFPKTAFVNTLESPLISKKNNVYAAALLFAWDEVRKTVKVPIHVLERYPNLTLLNNSTSYKGVLLKEDIHTQVTIKSDTIEAYAHFKKSLSLLNNFIGNQLLSFGNQKVKSFTWGMGRYGFISILYYKNDEDFVIQLVTKEDEQEIILAKGISKNISFESVLKELNLKIRTGIKESEDYNQKWKYEIISEDELLIPNMSFNLESEYELLKDNEFKVGTDSYRVISAYQQIAVLLNEKGMEVESKSTITTINGTTNPLAEKPHPKHLIFDCPFLLIAKRKSAKNPYLAMWIENTELMEKY